MYRPRQVRAAIISKAGIESRSHRLDRESDYDLQSIAFAAATMRRAMVINAMRKDKKAGRVHFTVPQEFTCDGCMSAPLCPYAFDPYNTDGDCLALK